MPDQDFQPSQQDISDYLKTGQITPYQPQSSGESAASQLLPAVFGLAAPALGKVAAGAIGKGLTALAGKGAASLASMGGPLAKLANPKMLEEYQRMKASGASPESIFDATKWFEAPGGHPRFEISDKGLSVKPMPAKVFGASRGVAGDFANHPELFENYPGSAHVPTAVDPDFGPEGTAELETAPYFKMTLGGPAGGILTPKQQAAFVHELGAHYPSMSVEGGEGGTNPDYIREHITDLLKGRKFDLINKGMDPIDPEIIALNDHIMNVNRRAGTMYRAVPGESEAENVTGRFMRQRFGAPPDYRPVTSDPDVVSQAFRSKGMSLEPMYMKRSEQTFPSGYSLSMVSNPARRVATGGLPSTLRSLYDRLPVESGHSNPYMAGEFKYPWKTEDLPRSMQRRWHLPQTYEDIPTDWLEALRQGK